MVAVGCVLGCWGWLPDLEVQRFWHDFYSRWSSVQGLLMDRCLWENFQTECHWQGSLVLEDAWKHMGPRSVAFEFLVFAVCELVPT